MSNPLPSNQQYGAQTVVKAVDKWKNEQSAAIRRAIQHEKRRVSRRRPEE